VSPSAPLSIPDLREALAEVGALRADVRRLCARIDAFEVRGPSPDLDRVLSVAETARAIGKAPTTLRHWLRDAETFDRHQLGALVRKDPTNHWISSPRLVARWRQVMFKALEEVAK
jgi:hypothetical protein